MDLQDSRMNSISNLNSVGDMLTSSQASIAGLGHSFGNLCGPLRMGGHMPAGSAGSGLRLSQMGHIGGPTESISQQQQQAAAAMHFPLSFQNPLFHLAAQNSPAQSQPHPPPLLLAPEPENGHHDYAPAFGNSAFSRSEDLSALRSQSSLVQPSIVHSHSYSDDFTRQNQNNDFAWHQLSLQVQVGISHFPSHFKDRQFVMICRVTFLLFTYQNREQALCNTALPSYLPSEVLNLFSARIIPGTLSCMFLGIISYG